MNEVFEKIIERLEHLLNNFGEHCEEWGENKEGDCQHKSCSDCVLNHAIEIVKQEAEQYNNGWIPCSERLPDKYEVVLVWCKGRFTEGTRIGEECRTHGIAYCYHGRTWHVYQSKAIKDIEVIAWQPLPSPYKALDNKELE